MWAVRLAEPGRLVETTVDRPTADDLAAGEALLQVEAGGICGSDLPKFRGIRPPSDTTAAMPPPGFPMHEVAGTVLASNATDLAVGDRVVGWARASDGLAERIVVRAGDVGRYDDRLSPPEAVVIQPLACVISALDRVEVADRHVAVLGLGPAGLLFAHVARSRGASSVTGVDPVDRSEVSAGCGIDRLVVGSSAQWASAPEREPDLVIEAVGHQAEVLEHAMRSTRLGGVVLCFGIPDERYQRFDIEALMRRDLTLVGGVTRDKRRALRAADAYLREHPALVGLLVTHVLGRDEVQRAFELAGSARSGRRKVVLDLSVT